LNRVQGEPGLVCQDIGRSTGKRQQRCIGIRDGLERLVDRAIAAKRSDQITSTIQRRLGQYTGASVGRCGHQHNLADVPSQSVGDRFDRLWLPE
jgi:hypothetical protein